MSSCCSSNSNECSSPRKRLCPANQRAGVQVERATVLHHLKRPWAQQLPEQQYYFCDDAQCDVVYFGEDDSVITLDAVRTAVGQKSQDNQRTLCYCYGITAEDYQREPECKTFVIAQTKDGVCACETRNPSGRCCLKDFPK